jgi:nucleoside-diphosphate-sugar epimerase
MATVFVTGVSGMIGKIVVASLLTKKHKVIGTDSKPCNLEGVDPNFQFIQTEITNKAGISQLFADNKIDFLVHLANTADNDFDAFISDKEMKQSKLRID